MEKEEIIEKLQQVLPEIKEKYHIISMGIFGSVARGDNTNKSDIDVLVEFDDQAVGFFDFIRIQKKLSDVLGKEVDFISKESLKKVIKESILKETIYVY